MKMKRKRRWRRKKKRNQDEGPVHLDIINITVDHHLEEDTVDLLEVEAEVDLLITGTGEVIPDHHKEGIVKRDTRDDLLHLVIDIEGHHKVLRDTLDQSKTEMIGEEETDMTIIGEEEIMREIKRDKRIKMRREKRKMRNQNTRNRLGRKKRMLKRTKRFDKLMN